MSSDRLRLAALSEWLPAGPLAVALAKAQDDLPGPAALPGGTVFEPKFDGFRLVIVRHPAGVRLWSRQGTELTGRFPDVAAAAERTLPVGSVVDGEVLCWRAGRTDFGALQRRLTLTGARLSEYVRRFPVNFLAFDVLAVDGRDLREQPLRMRRAVLEQLATWRPPLQLTPSTTDPNQARGWMHDWARAGIEGVVAKGVGSRYRGGVRGWVKVKSRHTVEAVIGAVTGPISRPHTLVVGRFDGERLVIAGRTTPLPRLAAEDLALHLTVPAGPHPWPATISAGFGRPRSERTELTRVEPVLVAELSADTAVDEGRHRHPVRFVRVRLDLRVADLLAAERSA